LKPKPVAWGVMVVLAVNIAGGAAAVLGVAVAIMSPAPIAAQDAAWPDTFTSRLEALAVIQTLNGNLLASRSATATLETWCRDHQLAETPQIVADAVPDTPTPPAAEQLQRLEVTQAADVKYRHVRLRCGTRVLSEADNWYVPARLTADMNRALETTDAPFGRVVAPLQPYRRTFAVTMLWAPLPAGWERGAIGDGDTGGGALAIPDGLFEHRAVLYTRENRPFSEVRETYQRAVLAFPPPRPR
jgi:chorismate-pyruvate lyase